MRAEPNAGPAQFSRSGRSAAADRVDHLPVAPHRQAESLRVGVAVDVVVDLLHALVHGLRHPLDRLLHQLLSLLHRIAGLLDELRLQLVEALAELAHLRPDLYLTRRRRRLMALRGFDRALWWFDRPRLGPAHHLGIHSLCLAHEAISRR